MGSLRLVTAPTGATMFGMTDKQLDAAVLKAVEQTNLCMLHMEYHGQKTKACTPQQRVVIKLKGEDEDADLEK